MTRNISIEALGRNSERFAELEEKQFPDAHNLLRFRDGWLRIQALDIRQAEDILFNSCSEDAASITALIEYSRGRVSDGLTVERRGEKELELGMVQGFRDFRIFPKDVTAAEKFHMCRIVCREKGRQRAKSRV
jgi:hypothetical protein